MPFSNEKTRSVYITANIACNLRCIYCYEKDKSNLESFDINRAKNTLRQVLSTPTEKGTIIAFHGGEPFLSYLKIRELCEWAWQQSFPEKFLFFATTNGTLIHGEIQNWLYNNKEKFILGLSIDGTRDMHNTNRTNSFDLIDIDYFVEAYPQQSVKMTISPKTLETLSQGIIFLHNKGFNEIAANLAEMVNWNLPTDLDIYRRELRKLSEFYSQNHRLKVSSLFHVPFIKVLDKTPNKWCGAGSELEAFDIDGTRHPCHLFFESVCGKEKSKRVHEIDFSDPEHYISKDCKPCPLINICPTCYGSNYIVRGSIAQRDMTLCEFTKVRMSEVAKHVYNTIVNDPIDVTLLSDEEKYSRLTTLKGIEKISSFLGLV